MASRIVKTAMAVREKLSAKAAQGKVQRYWPGKKPEWAEEAEEEDEEEKPQEEKPKEEDLVQVTREDDPRLRRLAESRRTREEAVARHREIRQAEIVSTREEEEDGEADRDRDVHRAFAEDEDEEDEEAVEERRRRNKARTLQRLKEEEEAAAAAAADDEEEEDEEEEEEEEEYETDSEDELGGIPMVKPIFVKKSERETIAERDRLEAEELAMVEEMKKKLELRKIETKHMVVEEIRKEEDADKNKVPDAFGEEVDTDEETNEAEEYEAWKAREIARIKRERDEKENVAKEKEEIEKLRKMTEEERKEFDRKNPKEAPAKKKKWRYMQKYYHQGAFFQTETSEKVLPGGNQIYERDYSEPTGEDKLNRSILPKVMQVKNFGRSNRTKWTHLVNEDTTRWDNPWTCNDKMRSSYNEKMAGMNKPIQKPQGLKLKRSAEDLYKV